MVGAPPGPGRPLTNPPRPRGTPMSGVLGAPDPDLDARASASDGHRARASQRAGQRGRSRVRANGEELAFGETFATSYHKGLPHGPTGFVDAGAYRALVDALLTQDHRRFEGLPVGDNFPTDEYPRRTQDDGEGRRKQTSPFTGHVFDLQGADAGALAVDGAPALASDEFAAELAELYAMALLRDVPFEDVDTGGGQVTALADALAGMPWFSGAGEHEPVGSRRRRLAGPADLFRGSTPGSRTGPWLSQFLLVGNKFTGRLAPGGASPAGPETDVAVTDGLVYYGTQVVDQRSVVAQREVDWLQTWASWLDAQNGVQFGGKDLFQTTRQFLTTPRDVATYVHFDALYQAYQVACLLMLADGAPFGFDRGLPETHSRTRSAFASYGGPHVLSLVTEVATRALKLVWRQKWMHHRRLRPEAAAALVTLHAHDPAAIPDDALRSAVGALRAKVPAAVLAAVDARNSTAAAKGRIPANGAAADLPDIADGRNYLLPMAFPEGSPTHPAYGAGHATVAGACVTALKAFFEMYGPDGRTELAWPLAAGDGPGGAGRYGFGDVWVGDGDHLEPADGDPELTVQGELDKLAANVAIARNVAGVHYYTDYFASVRQGERLTVSVLEDQAALYNEPMSMSFTSFDGDRVRVRGHGGTSSVSVVDRDGHAVAAADWYQRYGA